MGQKVNPIIFRRALNKPTLSGWFSRNNLHPHLLFHDIEIRNFLESLLQSRGIVLRSCKIFRDNNTLSLSLDLYFSYLLAKQSKFFWAKKFFNDVRKKYISLNRIKDLKRFLDTLQQNFFLAHASNLILDKSRKKTKDTFINNRFSFDHDLSLDYKNRFFSLLLFKEKKRFILSKRKKMSVLSIVKRSHIVKVVRIKFSNLYKLFALKKIEFCFYDFCCKKNINIKKQPYTLDLLNLNGDICKSLQHFTGVEKIDLKIGSSQLMFLPTLKPYYSFFMKELIVFHKNRNISKFFFETIEILYFSLGTFSYGNAVLLSKLISFLLENTRKHVFVIRFIKKVLNILFWKLPPDFLSSKGIKILIKGRFNKRRRTKTIILQEGQISLQTFDVPLDYNQTKAVTLYGSFGIKVWLSKK